MKKKAPEVPLDFVLFSSFYNTDMIAKDLAKPGVSHSKIQSQLCKIMQGKDLYCETADLLCKYFRLELVSKRPKRAKK